MPIYKKILILIILAIFIYIIYSLITARVALFKQTETFIEGMVDKVGIDASKLDADKRVNASGITNINTSISDRPLKEYIIKSSYNTAISGNHVNLDMIKHVLSKGCRFLDFEVFYDGKDAFVSYSHDATYKTLQTDSSYSLTTVLNKVMGSAFNTDSPNPHDPLFIQLRVKSNNTNVYRAVAASIHSSLLSKLYPEEITEKTTLNDIMKKVVLVMDKTINVEYKDHADCSKKETKTVHEKDEDCYDLTNYINVESGSNLMRLARYSDMLDRKTNPPEINDDNDSTTVSKMQVVIPDVDYRVVNNPTLSPFVLKYGCQMVLYRFYNNDSNLVDYEDFFKHFKTAFVPLTRAISYLKKKEEHNIS
uniref:Phosphatidylinositol-specific phospholipase C X domain-containing protein n=1 Tax=viral metagenome TaxID=1070528 RepID=A0A6C0DQ92_9ZZZZ